MSNLPPTVAAEVRRLVEQTLEERAEKTRKYNREAQKKAREGRHSITFLVPIELHRRFKAVCAAQEITQTTALHRLLVRYVDDYEVDREESDA